MGHGFCVVWVADFSGNVGHEILPSKKKRERDFVPLSGNQEYCARSISASRSIYHISIDPSEKPLLVATLGFLPVVFGITSLGAGEHKVRRRNLILALIGVSCGLLFAIFHT